MIAFFCGLKIVMAREFTMQYHSIMKRRNLFCCFGAFLLLVPSYFICDCTVASAEKHHCCDEEIQQASSSEYCEHCFFTFVPEQNAVEKNSQPAFATIERFSFEQIQSVEFFFRNDVVSFPFTNLHRAHAPRAPPHV